MPPRAAPPSAAPTSLPRLAFGPLSPSYRLEHALCQRQRVCLSAGEEASPFSQKKGDLGARPSAGNPSSRQEAPLLR